MRAKWATPAIIAALVGCAQGETDPPGLPSLHAGVYELTTVSVEEGCAVTDAITPGNEFVGKVQRVSVEPMSHGVRMQVCDPFFEDACMPPFEEQYTWSALQQGTDLVAGATTWAPDCLCFTEIAGSRTLAGEVVDDLSAELEWSIDVPAMPADCSCAPASGCAGKVEQILSLL